ncbi:uncharacterized protein LOC143292275, partial [Babylonia areolata]|uniref:uncharacterized protein LOC143292275 n=1 Tax=Babylonia areolata TaxID=304850 RepID=UPI003FD4A11A
KKKKTTVKKRKDTYHQSHHFARLNTRSSQRQRRGERQRQGQREREREREMYITNMTKTSSQK